MKMYKTSNYGKPIEEIDVVKYNDKNYWYKTISYNGKENLNRSLRYTTYANVYETLEEAKEYMIDKTHRQIDNTKSKLSRLLELLKEIRDYGN